MAEEGSAEDLERGKNTTESFNGNQDAAKEEDTNRVEDEDESEDLKEVQGEVQQQIKFGDKILESEVHGVSPEKEIEDSNKAGDDDAREDLKDKHVESGHSGYAVDLDFGTGIEKGESDREKQSLNLEDTVFPESENLITVRKFYDDKQKLKGSTQQFKNEEQDDVPDIVRKFDILGTEVEKIAERLEDLRSEFDDMHYDYVNKTLCAALFEQSDTETRTTVDSLVPSHIDEGVSKAEEEMVQVQEESEETQSKTDQTANSLAAEDLESESESEVALRALNVINENLEENSPDEGGSPRGEEPIWPAILVMAWTMTSLAIAFIFRGVDTEEDQELDLDKGF